MKYKYYVNDNLLQIKMESENAEEIFEIMNLGQQIKKPLHSFGGIIKDGAFMWINIPLKKREYKMIEFNNDK